MQEAEALGETGAQLNMLSGFSRLGSGSVRPGPWSAGQADAPGEQGLLGDTREPRAACRRLRGVSRRERDSSVIQVNVEKQSLVKEVEEGGASSPSAP